MKLVALIVAGGTGSRMRTLVPKQFAVLDGLPVLMYTIRAFYASDGQPEIFVALNSAMCGHWASLCEQYQFQIPHTITPGGSTRYESVKRAIAQIDDPCLIAVHDAVRPVIDAGIIRAAYRLAAEKGSAVTAVKSRDSVRQRQGTDGNSSALKRDDIYLVQTPQIFRSDILRAAYDQPYDPLFTDDASVVEKAGYPVYLVEGSPANIKITYPEDLLLAEILLKQKNPIV